jgi:hypothetical protein
VILTVNAFLSREVTQLFGFFLESGGPEESYSSSSLSRRSRAAACTRAACSSFWECGCTLALGTQPCDTTHALSIRPVHSSVLPPLQPWAAENALRPPPPVSLRALAQPTAVHDVTWPHCVVSMFILSCRFPEYQTQGIEFLRAALG